MKYEPIHQVSNNTKKKNKNKKAKKELTYKNMGYKLGVSTRMFQLSWLEKYLFWASRRGIVL